MERAAKKQQEQIQLQQQLQQLKSNPQMQMQPEVVESLTTENLGAEQKISDDDVVYFVLILLIKNSRVEIRNLLIYSVSRNAI